MKKYILVFLVIVIIALGYLYVQYEEDIIPLSEPSVEPYKQMQVIIKEELKLSHTVIDKEILDNIYHEGEISYLPESYIKSFLYYSYDSKNQIVSLASRNQVIYFNLNDQITEIGEKVIHNVDYIKKDDQFYFSAEILEKYFDIVIDYAEKQKTIYIYQKGTQTTFAKLKDKKIMLRKNPKTGSVSVEELTPESSLIVSKYDSTWYIGYSENKGVGYLLASEIQSIEKTPAEKVVYNTIDEPVNLTWEQVHSYRGNPDSLEKIPGVNVISPTWYKLINDQGDFKSLVKESYIDSAKEHRYDLWVLTSNTFNDIEMTSRFLKNAKARKKFIKNLLIEYKKYGFEGINLDFEHIYKEDKDLYTQFVAELTAYFSKEDIIVSADVTVMGGSDNWSLCYDRKELGEILDYLIVMTYDETWASSPKSGSVATYSWVDTSLGKITEIVEPSRVVMGIPLYTRIWYEKPSKKVVNAMDVSSKAITMHGQKNVLEKQNIKPLWDADARQFFISYIEDGFVKKIWLEEEVSIQAKASLVKKHNLAGVATWSRGFETSNIWEVIEKELK